MNSQTHLTHRQLCDLVIDSPLDRAKSAFDPVHDHLRTCYTCAADLAALTGSLQQFQAISHTVAQREYSAQRESSSLHHSSVSAFSARRPAVRWLQPLYFAMAAALLVAAALPLTLSQHHAMPVQQPAQANISAAPEPASISDEALLEGVDQDLSASIPDSMQPLADPTAASSAATSTSTQRTN